MKLLRPSTSFFLYRSRPAAATGCGLDDLRDAVIEAIGADFADAEVVTGAANGKVLSYLSAHAEIEHQQYEDSVVKIRCRLPRHLLHHIQGPDVQVRFIDRAAANGSVEE